VVECCSNRPPSALASAYALSPLAAASSQDSEKPAKAIENKMVGLVPAHEQFTVPQLIDIGISAEQAGFNLLATSDHFQPWQANESHSGVAWATLGALSQRNEPSVDGNDRDLPRIPVQPGGGHRGFRHIGFFGSRAYLSRFRTIR
jgi:hypothetical protein